MNWLDTQTKEILQKAHEPKLAPPKAAEFALVLLRKGADHPRLVRAICRINECREAGAIELARLPEPVTVNSGLTQEEALFGQFELICCDAIAVFIRSEVLLEQHQEGYLRSLYQTVLQSPEFKPTRIDVLEVPATDPGEKFMDQFVGNALSAQKRRLPRFSVLVPFKKARIMTHWAKRVGARVQCGAVQDSNGEGEAL